MPDGKPLADLDKIRADYSMVMHRVSMSIGSSDPRNQTYFKKLKHLMERVEPKWVPDHLCWTSVEKLNSHERLPFPYNDASINHVADRISQVQVF